MRTPKIILSSLFLMLCVFNASSPNISRAAPPPMNPRQPLAPIRISEDEFQDAEWTVTAEVTGGASYTVHQQLSGGYITPSFRFMSHTLPPVTGDGLAIISVNHIYLGASYDPGTQGEISSIYYSEAGIILSFSYPEAFSTTRPALSQGGRIFRSTEFFRFIAQNSSHAWETKSLSHLTAADFVAVDGSGDHPDFSTGGSPIQFGFTRTNSRSSTLPPVPGDQDMVIDQGVDYWQVWVYHPSDDDVNLPPQAEKDVFILDGNTLSLPLRQPFDVVRNDSDPDLDHLEVIEVTEPIYGEAGAYTSHSIFYQLSEATASDSFYYTISDGAITSSAQVEVLVDCACTVLCLNDLEPPRASSDTLQPTDTIDLPLIYRVRDQILKSTPDGRRYVDMYYTSNPEILVNIMMHETLRNEAIATVELWQGNLSNLIDGDGNQVITQAQVDAVESFLNNLSAVSSAQLQGLIASELDRLGPLDDYVGMTVEEAKRQAIGDPTIFLPLITE